MQSASLSILAQPILAQEGGGFASLPFLLIAFAAMYFLLIRPQQKRVKAQRQLVSSIGVGDRIITVGGIHGVVESLDEDTLMLQIAPNILITMNRSAVGRRVVDASTGTDVAADDEE